MKSHHNNLFPLFSVGFPLLLLLLLLVLCLPNVSNKYYHETGLYQLYVQHKVGLVRVAWENIVSTYRAAMDLRGKSLGKYVLVSLCFNIYYVFLMLQTFYRDTVSDQLSSQHKTVMVSVVWEKNVSDN